MIRKKYRWKFWAFTIYVVIIWAFIKSFWALEGNWDSVKVFILSYVFINTYWFVVYLAYPWKNACILMSDKVMEQAFTTDSKKEWKWIHFDCENYIIIVLVLMNFCFYILLCTSIYWIHIYKHICTYMSLKLTAATNCLQQFKWNAIKTS